MKTDLRFAAKKIDLRFATKGEKKIIQRLATGDYVPTINVALLKKHLAVIKSLIRSRKKAAFIKADMEIYRLTLGKTKGQMSKAAQKRIKELKKFIDKK